MSFCLNKGENVRIYNRLGGYYLVYEVNFGILNGVFFERMGYIVRNVVY